MKVSAAAKIGFARGRYRTKHGPRLELFGFVNLGLVLFSSQNVVVAVHLWDSSLSMNNYVHENYIKNFMISLLTEGLLSNKRKLLLNAYKYCQ